MKVNLEYVSERDIDFVLMRSIITYPKFRDYFFKEGFKGKYKNIEIISCSHSVDTDIGESDVVIEAKCDKGILQLHIEDKIDAIAMPRQCLRYIDRCKRNVEDGKCIDYAIFLVAPSDYLKNEKQPYPHRVSDETILKLLKEVKADKLDIALVENAINKKTHPTIIEDTRKTDFWMEYYQFISGTYPDLVKRYSEKRTAKGVRSVWHRFNTGLNGIQIVAKYNKDAVDIQLEGMSKRKQEVIDKFSNLIPDEYDIVKTSQSLSIRAEIPHVDFNKPFVTQSKNVRCALEQVEKSFALLRELKKNGIKKSPF